MEEDQFLCKEARALAITYTMRLLRMMLKLCQTELLALKCPIQMSYSRKTSARTACEEKQQGARQVFYTY
jgi:hypothetical protein